MIAMAYDSVSLRIARFFILAFLVFTVFPVLPLSANETSPAPASAISNPAGQQTETQTEAPPIEDPPSTSGPDQVVEPSQAQADDPKIESDPSIRLQGTVWRTRAGIVFLKTPVGTLTLSSKTTLKDLKGSHEIIFWLDERSMVVEVRRRSDHSLLHRYLTGPLTPGQDDSKTLRWRTAHGEQTLHVGTQEEKLASYQEGDPVTVEVDDSATIIGVHNMEFDLQINQIPPAGSPAHLLLSGTVSKLKSKFVFFRTEVGVVMVNSKIGLPRVKIGQFMTLRIDNGEVDVSLGKGPKSSATEEAGPSATTSSPS